VFAAVLPSLLLCVRACSDFDKQGCRFRAEEPDFCLHNWGLEHCCATCTGHPQGLLASTAPMACKVPRQKCVAWSCAVGSIVNAGGSCRLTVREDLAMCKRCSVVDSSTCAPYPSNTTRTCLSDGTWSGLEPACRSFCDATFDPHEWNVVEPVETQRFSKTKDPSSPAFEKFEVRDIEAPPHGDFLSRKHVSKYMSYRIDFWGHWFVLFTGKCSQRYGVHAALHVANQYAQWLDWQGTGKPNNQEVFAQLVARNATMVMFDTADGPDLDRFYNAFPFDEVLDNKFMHPHDVECDETPHLSGEPDSYDAAYCEILQQIFNMGYRPVFPDVFYDRPGSLAAKAMDALIGDCGHAYDHTFKYPNCFGKYHYRDKTCDYGCLVSEYLWWSLTTLLGGQDGHLVPPIGSIDPPSGRCEEIGLEWEQCSKELLEKHDPTIVAILTDPKYNLPTKLPFGTYSPHDTSEHSLIYA